MVEVTEVNALDQVVLLHIVEVALHMVEVALHMVEEVVNALWELLQNKIKMDPLQL